MFILFSFFNICPFAQILTLNTTLGTTLPTSDSFFELNDSFTSTNSGELNICELNIDYGKDEYLIKPYLAVGYGFQILNFSEKTRFSSPSLSENVIYSEIGIKKTFHIEKAKISFLGGIGYQWNYYKIRYQKEISININPNNIKYQLGLQMNFKFLKNLDAIIAWRYVFIQSEEYHGTFGTTKYSFYSNSDYQIFSIGAGMNISKLFK